MRENCLSGGNGGLVPGDRAFYSLLGVLLFNIAEEVFLQMLLSWNWLLSDGIKIFEVNCREGET